MSKIEEFKTFVKTKPNLIKHIEDGSMTWQKFYEIYDIYGENNEAWQKYEEERNNLPNLKTITDALKKIDIDSVQKKINSAQKAIDVVSDLAPTKNPNIIKGPKDPRPITKLFED